jgi:hypothetical protein
MTKRETQAALIAKLYRYAGDVHREVLRAGGGFDGDREAWHIVFAGLEYLFGSKPEIWLPAGEGRKRVVKAYDAIVGGKEGHDASELATNIEWAVKEARGNRHTQKRGHGKKDTTAKGRKKRSRRSTTPAQDGAADRGDSLPGAPAGRDGEESAFEQAAQMTKSQKAR